MRWGDEVFVKELHAFSRGVGCFCGAVSGGGHDEKFEVFVGLDEGFSHLHRACGVDVGVGFSDDEEEVALEFVGVGNVRVLGVPRADEAEPCFVPPDLVHPVVVASAVGDGCAVEVAVVEECCEGVLASGTASVDADARQVHPGAIFGSGFHPSDTVGETCVIEVAPCDIVERF